jgi:uncharacterized membrane protein
MHMILLHVGSIVLTLLFVVYADEQGLQYLRGKRKTLQRERVRALHRIVAAGLSVIIATGALMVYQDPAFYFGQATYWVKMCFVLVLVVNACVIGFLSRFAVVTPFQELAKRDQWMLLASGGVSAFSWVATILLGLSLSGWW